MNNYIGFKMIIYRNGDNLGKFPLNLVDQISCILTHLEGTTFEIDDDLMIILKGQYDYKMPLLYLDNERNICQFYKVYQKLNITAPLFRNFNFTYHGKILEFQNGISYNFMEEFYTNGLFRRKCMPIKFSRLLSKSLNSSNRLSYRS
jgi:hypothetical protein